ncbi:MAG: ATP-binding cassette domain-containing protein [Myxococcales bacterium]|nr:ATP-binding cassette domain-containing protein [Myxococcales bacterium]
MLELHEVWAGRGRRDVLKGISLEAKTGEVMCLLGPNGAGKSTLMDVVGGFLRPSKGTCSLNGRDVPHIPASELAKLRAFLPQQSGLDFPFTVEEVVALGLLPSSRLRRHAVGRALELAGVNELLGRRYTELSGGEKQRVQIARVFCQVLAGAEFCPQLMLLDEPTSDLDLRRAADIVCAIRTVASLDVAVVCVVHDFNLVSQLADHVVVLRDGVIAAQGPPVEVVTATTLAPIFEVNLLQLHDQSGPAVALIPQLQFQTTDHRGTR